MEQEEYGHVLWTLCTGGQRGVLRAAQCVVLGMEHGDTGWDHGGEMDRSWIDRSRDGWIEGWMDRGSINTSPPRQASQKTTGPPGFLTRNVDTVVFE